MAGIVHIIIPEEGDMFAGEEEGQQHVPVRFLTAGTLRERARRTPLYNRLINSLGSDSSVTQAYIMCRKYIENDVLINPVSFLKDMANHVRRMANIVDGYYQSMDSTAFTAAAKDVPFYVLASDEPKVVEKLHSCPGYPRLVGGLYSGLFCAGDAVAEAEALTVNAAEEASSSLYNNENFLVDTDLMCIFAGLVSLQTKLLNTRERKNYTRQYLCMQICRSLETLPGVFATEWGEWPFSTVKGGPRARDLRTFCTMLGTDTVRRRESDWVSAPRALHLTYYDPSFSCSDESLRVYAARPVHDAFRFIPEKYLNIIFGEKLMKVMTMVKYYCSINAPFLLASDTSPVKTDRSMMVPSGCGIPSICPNLTPTDKLTLVSRHAIPTARRLGLHLLKSTRKDSISMERSIAECMVENSIAECMVENKFREDLENTDGEPAASIMCPETEIETVAAHVAGILKTATTARSDSSCVLCFKTLNLRPQNDDKAHIQRNVSSFDFFAFHSFMDTFECSSTTCSASACPECTIRLVLSIYEKVTSSGGVKLKDAFRCPHCGEYMVNFLGRSYEFSNLCRRTFAIKGGELPSLLLARAESCFAALELLQGDFLETYTRGEDIIGNSYPKFYIRENSLRPVVKKQKLSQSGSGNSRCSLSCTKCLTPVACDEPVNEEDFETIAVPPPVAPLHEFDVEDASFDDGPSDELVQYDDGPGTHRWPAKLSCGLVAAATTSSGCGNIQTCVEAIAFLGRAPRKKFRGWNAETPEGKAIIALANWQKSGRVPLGMEELLSAVQAVHMKKHCFCNRTSYYPFVVGRDAEGTGILEEVPASEIPLISSFFAERSAIGIAGGQTVFLSLADLYVRNMLSEILLQTPECVLHRAHSFTLSCLNTRSLMGKRPDAAAKIPYIQEINAVRRTTRDGLVRHPTYTEEEHRTVEWVVEKGGDAIKMIPCSSCGSQLVKAGGCVTVACDKCGNVFCWICEASNTDQDHVVKQHRLLYSSSVNIKRALQKLYGVRLCSLKLVDLEDSYLSKGGNGSGSVEVYVMEDGFDFDVNEGIAVVTQ